jgi:prevent-host-death family protein
VKARLSEIAEEVAATHEHVQITKNGRDYVVLVAAEDMESIEATLELLGDPEAQKRVKNAEEDIGRPRRGCGPRTVAATRSGDS